MVKPRNNCQGLRDHFSLDELEELVLMDDKLFKRLMLKKRNELKSQLKVKERELDKESRAESVKQVL